MNFYSPYIVSFIETFTITSFHVFSKKEIFNQKILTLIKESVPQNS